MNQKKHLSILEFSRLTGIKRENLRFYDRIGLLTPETRGPNGYRYYARRQLSAAYLIGSLRLLGVGLEDIRQYSKSRTPDKMLTLFARQEESIQAEIEKLRETSHIMKRYADMAREALRHREDDLLLVERPRERIFLCPPISEGVSEEDGGIASYEYANAHGINLGYPSGIWVTQGPAHWESSAPTYHYYFKTGKKGNAWKPAGLYAVAYGRGDPSQSEGIYRRLYEFIGKQGLTSVGGAYEEFLLDELAVPDAGQYFYRVEAPVTRQ